MSVLRQQCKGQLLLSEILAIKLSLAFFVALTYLTVVYNIK